ARARRKREMRAPDARQARGAQPAIRTPASARRAASAASPPGGWRPPAWPGCALSRAGPQKVDDWRDIGAQVHGGAVRPPLRALRSAPPCGRRLRPRPYNPDCVAVPHAFAADAAPAKAAAAALPGRPSSALPAFVAGLAGPQVHEPLQSRRHAGRVNAQAGGGWHHFPHSTRRRLPVGQLIEGEWHDKWYDTSGDGRFKREEAGFRDWLSADGGSGP